VLIALWFTFPFLSPGMHPNSPIRRVRAFYASQTASQSLCWLLGCAAVCTLLALVGLCWWETSGYTVDLPPYDHDTWAGYDGLSVTGLLLFTTFATLAVALLYVVSQQFARQALAHASRGHQAQQLSRATWALGCHALLAAVFVAVGGLGALTWGADPLKCGVIFCIGVARYAESATGRPINGASVNAEIGMAACFTLCPLGLLMLYRTAMQWAEQRRLAVDHALSLPPQDPRERGGATMQMYRPISWHWQLLRIVCALVVILFFMTLTFYLPNNLRSFVASRISWVAYATPSEALAPEIPSAVFKTHVINLGTDLNLKIYPGNLVFYLYLMLVVLIIGTLRLSSGGRYTLQRRLTWLPTFTVAEAILTLLTTLLTVLFGVYWCHDHNYKWFWKPTGPQTGYIQPAEFWGRATGQLAVLFLSLCRCGLWKKCVVQLVEVCNAPSKKKKSIINLCSSAEKRSTFEMCCWRDAFVSQRSILGVSGVDASILPATHCRLLF